MIWLGKGAMCLTGTAHQSILSIKLQAEGRTQAYPNISCHFLCPTLTPVSGAQHYSSAEGQTPSWCHAFAIRVSLFEARHPWCLMVTCSCIALFDALNVLWNMSTTKKNLIFSWWWNSLTWKGRLLTDCVQHLVGGISEISCICLAREGQFLWFLW